MRLIDRLETVALPVVDRLFARMPQPRPDPVRMAACRVVAHRGAHGPGRPENTLAAFDAALAAGVWGLEFDLRWTRDLVPVVVHDPDLRRVFGLDLTVGRVEAAELRRRCPQVPTLAEVLDRCGGRAHLMVELKAEPLPEPGLRNRILRELFAGLAPVRDFHLLSLSLGMLEAVGFAPAAACVPVAGLNLLDFSRAALARGWGGVAGHYALAGSSLVARHHRAGQAVGTGYIRSANALYREVGRGVDWVFSNHAVELQRILRRPWAP
jgi:glycerophosphoryl diester phosphodiesterase